MLPAMIGALCCHVTDGLGGLAFQSWTTPEGDAIYLIESHKLRKHYGKLIGDIASSHHWSIEDVASKLHTQLNAPPGFPREWRVDPIKVACLLRCADAAHIDSRRAPDFLRALATLHGISAQHWTAQNWLERADRDTADPEDNAIIFTSGRPGVPTFWPLANSSFLSLERDGDGNARITSALSCIERRAETRGIKIVARYAGETAVGHFGKMPVLLLSKPS